MTGSAFFDRDVMPDEAALSATLGRTRVHWDAVVAHATAEGDVEPVWKHYGKKHGWQLKLMRKRRALLFLVPHERSFLAGLALPADDLDAVRAAGLPADLIEAIQAGPVYREGRPARVEVTSQKDVKTVKKLIRLKRGA